MPVCWSIHNYNPSWNTELAGGWLILWHSRSQGKKCYWLCWAPNHNLSIIWIVNMKSIQITSRWTVVNFLLTDNNLAQVFIFDDYWFSLATPPSHKFHFFILHDTFFFKQTLFKPLSFLSNVSLWLSIFSDFLPDGHSGVEPSFLLNYLINCSYSLL